MTPADALRTVLTDDVLDAAYYDMLGDGDTKTMREIIIAAVLPLLTAEREKVETMRVWIVEAKLHVKATAKGAGQ